MDRELYCQTVNFYEVYESVKSARDCPSRVGNECTVAYTTDVVQESSIDLVTKFGKGE